LQRSDVLQGPAYNNNIKEESDCDSNGILEVTVSLSDRNTNLADWVFSSVPQIEVNTDAVPAVHRGVFLLNPPVHFSVLGHSLLLNVLFI
jgi:hypothetical protein